ncbi:hypothetical protein BDZ97DRAFT_2076584 [Flammula alnicola]|nr:hypothetical protein BDZ97DRAFT_2076584 [Flammula alnicola]
MGERPKSTNFGMDEHTSHDDFEGASKYQLPNMKEPEENPPDAYDNYSIGASQAVIEPERLSQRDDSSVSHDPASPAVKSMAKNKGQEGRHSILPDPKVCPAEERAIQGYEGSWHGANERREREFDRQSRELDRRERELERRERELERRQREFDQDKARWMTEVRTAPFWQEAIDVLRNRIEMDLLAERNKALKREAELQSKVMKKVNKFLEQERQLHGVMRMSDNEANEMVENSVGYHQQSDKDNADCVRLQSLLYLSQERLASEAGLQPGCFGSLSLVYMWRLAMGPSIVTENRYNEALERLNRHKLDKSIKRLMESKTAMEYVVEYTSHLRKEGPEMGDHFFTLGRIARKDYMETVRRQASQAGLDYEALTTLVTFICPK